MSVLFTGIEMPTSCDLCWFTDCIYNLKNTGLKQPNGKSADCPLVPVPPHGDLIDRNAIINALQELFDRRNKDAEYMGFRGAFVSWNDAIYYINDAPTIIKADVPDTNVGIIPADEPKEET